MVTRLLQESEELIEHSMNTDIYVLEDYINIAAVQQVYSQYKSSGGVEGAELIYDVMTLIHWVKRLARF